MLIRYQRDIVQRVWQEVKYRLGIGTATAVGTLKLTKVHQ